MRYALGIDGGGSKCDAVLIEETGVVAGWGRGGPTHGYYDSPQVVHQSLLQAIAGALQGVCDAEIWLGGYLPSGECREAIERAGKLERVVPAGEVSTAFASVQEDWGVIVLSGTGAFVHGRTPDGRNLHVDSLGPILGDYGSAYSIGLRGLRAAFASSWAKARRTTLVEVVPRLLGADDLHGVFELAYVKKALGRRQIASIAKAVNEEAEKGDRIAIRCLQEAADELAELAIDVIDELGMQDLTFPVIAIGGVAQHSRLWWERVCARIATAAPHSRPIIPRVRPAVGAALQALKAMGVPWTSGLLDRIVETQQPFLTALDEAARHGR